MSGIEAFGIVLGAVPLILSAFDHNGVTRTAFAGNYRQYITNKDEYGWVVTFLLNTIFSDAVFVMDRVERYVLHTEDHHVIAFIKSYTSSFNMIGVAGAIIAQVAISAMSLDKLEDSHWTAEAFFVVSLVTGCLSVFFSCAINPAFHGLHSAEDIKDFLTKPTPSANTREFNSIVSEIKKRKDQVNDFSDDEMNTLRAVVETERWKVPSAYAAVMLVVPMTLLNISLNAFLVGLGIYLGSVHTAKLIPVFGSGSLGILVFYLFSGLFGIGMYYVAQSLKYLEGTPLAHWRRILDDHRIKTTRAEQSGDESSKHEGDTGIPRSRGHFLQSRHVRAGGRVRFAVDEPTHHSVQPDELSLGGRPKISLEDRSSLFDNEEDPPTLHSQLAPSTSEPPGKPEAVVPPGLDVNNIRVLLKELIRTQEQNLFLNQRLLEAFDTA